MARKIKPALLPATSPQSPLPRKGLLRRAQPSLPAPISGPDSGLNKAALLAELAALAKSISGTDSAVRAAALALFKQALADGLSRARTLFEEGRLGGLETARLLASLHSDIVEVLFEYTTGFVIRAPNPTAAERISVCAVGGFGRAEMAPGSDLDLLFLQTDSKASAWGESVTEYMLYLLWDMGLKVGQSTRSADQCIRLAKEDQTILTALLDARFICGDAALAHELMIRFRKEVAKGKGRAYVRAKLEERDTRHDREGNSRYVIEPNVKEGKGGLRDLHVLYWIARFLDKAGQINDPQRASDYVAMGLFDKQAADRFVRAADFLWRTRCHLHWASGRPTETLTFDFQTQLARKMGYASGPIELAVEKFMREYFTNAREVGALTRIACAKLEEANAILLPQGLVQFLPRSRKGLKAEGFKLSHGRLDFDNALTLKEHPQRILTLFQIAGEQNLDLHPDALRAIDFRRNLIDNNFRKDPKHAQIFLDILLKSKTPGAVMKVMNEAGVLGRYLIEFGGIVARTQFNMHHAYTVDEHTIGLVRYFHDLETGKLAKENPLATAFVKDFTSSQRRVLYLACLLHDTGKGVGDQCIEGARLSRRACRRLGLDSAEVNTISWLIRHHLDMSETAQRRDISDPATIAAFAEIVGSAERLQMLMALTIVDIRAVGPGIWNDWKGVLLRDLYTACADYLEDKPTLAPRSRAASAKETLFDRLPETVLDHSRPLFDRLGDGYWLSTTLTEQVRHARFFDGVGESGQDTAVQTRLDKARDVTEVWVLARDRQGLFADLSGAISACGASIVGARLNTGEAGLVFDIFFLQNSSGLAYGRDSTHQLETLRDRALAAARAPLERPKISAPLRSRRADAIPIKPAVRIIHDLATPAPLQDEAQNASRPTLIEIEGRDRPGLLYALARALTDFGLIIRSAHIEVVGVMAVDTFYVVDAKAKGEGALEDARAAELTARLMAALDPEAVAA